MHVVTGWLRFEPEDRDEVLKGLVEITELSRRDPGCVDYWWAEAVDAPNTFHFFECWESEELFEAHRDLPHEHEFMERYVTRVTGVDAHVYDAGNRRSAMG